MKTRISRALIAAPFAVALLLLTACKGSTTGGVISGPTPPPSNGSIYLTDSTVDSVTGQQIDQVLVFPQNTNGGPVPAQDIIGTVTGLSVPQGVAVDNAGNIWVTNTGTSSITEFAAGSTGNVAPINTVQGSATSLSTPIGITFDANSNMFVVNSAIDGSGFYEILEFGPNPVGNQAPINRIGGSAALLNTPQYDVVDGNGNLYVTNIGSNAINIYGPGSSGNVAPIVSYGGNCQAPDGIALDSANHIYLSCDQFYEIREYTALSGTSIPTQIRSLGVNASQPQLYNPSGIAINSLGTLFVANTGLLGQALGYVTIYGPNFNNSSSPGAAISGGNSNVFRPAGVALH
jgi:sugar lactone lactonase YvrE